MTVDSRFKTSIRWFLFFFHQFSFYFVIARDPIVEKHFCKIYKNKFCKITKTKLQKLISVRCFGLIMRDCPQLEPQWKSSPNAPFKNSYPQNKVCFIDVFRFQRVNRANWASKVVLHTTIAMIAYTPQETLKSTVFCEERSHGVFPTSENRFCKFTKFVFVNLQKQNLWIYRKEDFTVYSILLYSQLLNNLRGFSISSRRWLFFLCLICSMMLLCNNLLMYRFRASSVLRPATLKTSLTPISSLKQG